MRGPEPLGGLVERFLRRTSRIFLTCNTNKVCVKSALALWPMPEPFFVPHAFIFALRNPLA